MATPDEIREVLLFLKGQREHGFAKMPSIRKSMLQGCTLAALNLREGSA